MKLKEDKKEALKALLQYNFDKALTGREEKSERFRKSYLYYMCMAPMKDDREISGYIEPVVRKAVEAIKPSLMNIFTENEKKAVTLRPSALVPGPVAKLVDERINNIFLRENDGYDIIERAITEALVTGDVFTKTFVEEKIIEDKVVLEDVPSDALALILSEFPDTDMEAMQEALTEKDGMISGTFKAKRIEVPVKIEFIPFNDLYISGSTEDIRNARYICHRIQKTVGELIEMGYDEDLVMSASTSSYDEDYLSLKGIVNDGVFKSSGEDDMNFADPMEREVFLYEHYVYTSLVGNSKKVKLYKVYATDKEILDVCECNSIPFSHGVPERIPGSFWGVSFYDKFGPAQDILSRLMRTMEYNAAATTYQRYAAIKGEYDQASLLNNRPGAIIEMNTPGAVTPFAMPSLSAPVVELMDRVSNTTREDLMSAVGVDVTGANMSATAAAITANSADLKDKVIARVLAYTLFRPLFESIYNILRDEDIFLGEIPGQVDPMSGQQMPPVPVYGSQLPQFFEFQVDVNTANDEGILAQQLVQLASMFSQWAQVPAPLVTPDSMLKIAERVTGLSESEISEYFQVAQPSEEEMAMQQMQQQDAIETADLQKQMLRAQVANAAALTVKTEQEIAEMILDGEAKRKRDEEKSLQAFKKLELQEFELRVEAETGTNLSASVK